MKNEKLLSWVLVTATMTCAIYPKSNDATKPNLCQGEQSCYQRVSNDEKRTKQNAMTKDPDLVWPEGKVYFELDSSVDLKMTQKIYQAMVLIEKNTCVKFWEKRFGGQSDIYITIQELESCPNNPHVKVGRKEQTIAFYPGHNSSEDIIRDLFHTLGRYNEHQRPDRDSHVTINWGNILPDFRRYFLIPRKVTNQQLPYDYHSMMHFDSHAFSSSSARTIETNDDKHQPCSFKMNDQPDSLDFLYINLLYCQATKLMVKSFKTMPLARMIMISWEQRFRPPLHYKVHVECTESCSNVQYVNSVGIKLLPSERSYLIESLRPCSRCYLWFYAVYNEATLDSGIFTTPSTLCTKPSASPKMSILVLTTDTTAMVRWQHLPCSSTNGKILRYTLIVDADQQGNSGGKSSVIKVNGQKTSFLITDLTPSTKYGVQISAVNEFGAGPYSDPVSFKTKPVDMYL